MSQRTTDPLKSFDLIGDDIVQDLSELYSLVGNGKYVAYITQTGNTAPNIIRVYENSANLTITPSYSDIGECSIGISPSIDATKFRASFQQLNGSGQKVDLAWNTSESFLGGVVDFVQFFTLAEDEFQNYAYSDGVLNGIIEITVYQ